MNCWLNKSLLGMTQVNKLRIYFVLPTDDTAEENFSYDVKLGFQLVSKYGGYAEWMKPTDCLNHEPQDKDVFVFDKFEGNAFETLRQNSSKYVILGARCLLTCLINSRCIPPNPHPVFSEGMRDLYITSTGFDLATKKQIQEKVQFMSGHYDSFLRGIITHLVAHNNLSSKAIQAYQGNIKIMKYSWIEDVWLQSVEGNVHGSDEIFNKHLSPLFHNLHITTSGVPKKEKDALREIIETHGGHFMKTLEDKVTNIVLLTKPEGEKFQFAKAWNIPCIRPAWVYDCVDAKAILSFQSYVVDSSKPKCSTPNKKNATVNLSANFTANLSVINNIDSNKPVTKIDETTPFSGARNDFQTPRINFEQSKVKNSKSAYLNVINNILLKNLKDAGLFLDGLNIFLYGFYPEETEKLKKILNKGGAIRFNELSESVTHVIAGKRDDANLPSLAKFGAYVLSVDWLVESMKLQGKANEEKFLLVNSANPSEPPSPMSKQGAQLLSQTEGRIPHFNLNDKNENEKLSQIDELLCRYNASQPGEPLNQQDLNPSTPNGSNPSISKTSNCSTDEFFASVTFFLSSDLSEEEVKYLEDLIVERRGQVVGKRHLGVPDYAIVPVIGATLTEVTAKEVVNIYFIKDCCVENCLLTPRYYHQPVAFVKNASPLKNCVISVSNYVHYGEREFMEMMIEALGGIAQPTLARRPNQRALKSTHLVCTEAQGQKYEGAVRWGLPVVHHDWLLKCAALGIRVSEKPYLIGDSKLLEKIPSEATLPSTFRANNTQSEKLPLTSQMGVPSHPEPSAPAKKTPIHNALARVKATETPKSGSPDPNRTITPTSPYGAFYGKGTPTPGTRKRIYKWMNQGAEFPLDPPSKTFENEGDSTPVSQLISRHLEMLKRKPEELPPDSPAGLFKKLNMDDGKENESKGSVASALQKIRNLEKQTSKDLKSPPPKKPGSGSEEKPVNVMSESQPRSEVGWEDPAEKEAALENLRKVTLCNAKVFMFLCIADQLEEAKQLIEDGEGIVSPLPYFDKKATHLIAGNLIRAEKLMGSIAAGLWILHPSYLEALKEGKNVNEIPEEDYEWGSKKQKFRLNMLSANAKEFAHCSYFWRVSIGSGEPRPFKDTKILLHLSEAKYDSFKRLIEAGGGKVAQGTPPHYHKVDATLCVYEANHSEPIEFASLAKQNILCVALVYISDILLRKKDAVEKNIVPQFLKYWNSK